MYRVSKTNTDVRTFGHVVGVFLGASGGFYADAPLVHCCQMGTDRTASLFTAVWGENTPVMGWRFSSFTFCLIDNDVKRSNVKGYSSILT